MFCIRSKDALELRECSNSSDREKPRQICAVRELEGSGQQPRSQDPFYKVRGRPKIILAKILECGSSLV